MGSITKVYFPLEGEKVVDAARTEALHAHTESAGGGWFPVGSNSLWHGGVHLAAVEGTAVVACADGVVLAARLAPAELARGEAGSRNFVLLQHTHASGKTFYTLCMHLAPLEGRAQAERAPWLDGARAAPPGAAGVDEALLAELEGGGVVAPGRTVAAGELLWWVGELGPSFGGTLENKRPPLGRRPESPPEPEGPTHGLHWSVFSAENLVEGDPAWPVVVDASSDCFMDAPAIERLFPTETLRDGRIDADELVAFYADPARAEQVRSLRTTVCSFQSEWSLDWSSKELERALKERRFRARGVADRYGPYMWWSEVDAAAFGVVHTVVKGEYLSLIALNHGVDSWETIYYHGKNGKFRELRPDPNTIEPGDQVWVPTSDGAGLPDPHVFHYNPIALFSRFDAEYWANRATARLELYQDAPVLGGRTRIGSCRLDADDVELGTSFADLGIAWTSTGELPPFGTAALTLRQGLAQPAVDRELSAEHLVRSRAQRGGYNGLVPTAPAVDRGGDMFARADTPDAELTPADLWPKGGHPLGEKVFSVRVTVGGVTATLPVLHPRALPPVEQRCGELVLSLGCDLVLDAPEGREVKTLPGPSLRFPAADFLGDAASVAAGTLEADLTIAYGNPAALPALHARTSMYRQYTGERGNAATMARWRAAVVAAADWVNAHLPQDVVAPITAHEVGVTFLSEGGSGVFAQGASDPIFNGYGDIGIDKLLTYYDADSFGLREYMHPDLVEMSRHAANIETGFAEDGSRFKTLRNLNVERACHGVATMVGYSKRKFALELGALGPWAGSVADLPVPLQYYWMTTCYNTSRMPKYLREYGVELHDRVWSKEDDHMKYMMESKFNVSWRAATFRYFLAMSPTWLP